MQLCIFEDIYHDRLEPLIYSRPTYDLVCGINSLRKKILRAYPDVKYSLHCRPYLEHFVQNKNPGCDVNIVNDEKCLFVNGRILAPPNMAKIIPLTGEDKLYVNNETIIAARVSGKKFKEIQSNLNDLLSESNFDGLPKEQVNIKSIDYIWNITHYNGDELRSDYEQLKISKKINNKNNILGKIYDGVNIVERDNIFIDEESVVKPGAVIDGSAGPVYIDKKAKIFSNSVIEGAVYIGEGTQIKSCARIYENVSIGQICKVGGEVEDTIFLPYSNKQHSGFLGHAYLGSWVNIGADTNCSDLKNNYGHVKVYVNGEIIDSGSQFLGVIMGDHTKTAINTMFNTGTIVGVSCNIFGSGFPPKYIPSFSWGGSDAVTTYDIDKSIETGKRVMARRKKEMSDAEEKLFRKIFDLTKKERRKRGYPY